MSFLLDRLDCRADNPELTHLIQGNPHIDARALVRSDVKSKNLTPGRLKELRDLIRDEADLHLEIGEARYRALLERFWPWYSTLTGPSGLAAQNSYFPYFVSKELGDPSIDVTPLPPKQRVVRLVWHQNQRDFQRQLPDHIGGRGYAPQRVDFIVRQCFPRFAEGRVAVQLEDWDDINAALSVDKRRGPRTLSDRFAFANYMHGWRRVDFLAQERDIATRLQDNPARDALRREMVARKTLLQRGPIYEQSIEEEYPDFDERHPGLEALMAQALQKPLDWNDYLNLADQVGATGSAQLLAVLRQVEKEVKGRALLELLQEAQALRDAGDKRRKYDLREGIEILAKLCSSLQKWQEALETFKQNTEEPRRQRDFFWFRQQADQILPPLRAFIGTLPQDLVRRAPAQICEGARPEDLEILIARCLDCFSTPFYRSLPTLIGELQLAQTDKFAQPKQKLWDKYREEPGFNEQFQVVLSAANTICPRVETAVKELFWALSQPSALQPKIFHSYDVVKQTSYDMEKLRAYLMRRLTPPALQEAQSRVYPTFSPGAPFLR